MGFECKFKKLEKKSKSYPKIKKNFLGAYIYFTLPCSCYNLSFLKKPNSNSQPFSCPVPADTRLSRLLAPPQRHPHRHQSQQVNRDRPRRGQTLARPLLPPRLQKDLHAARGRPSRPTCQLHAHARYLRNAYDLIRQRYEIYYFK